MTRRVALALAGLALCSSGCRQTPEARAERLKQVEVTRAQNLARRLALAANDTSQDLPLARWNMPPQLREISGLALMPNGHVLAHDDEVAKIYEIDPKTGVIVRSFALNGAPRGDFEAITIVNSDIYLLQSNGKLYWFKEGEDGHQVPYSRFDTRLGKECEFEGLAYERDSSWLVMPCKKATSKSVKHELVIYRLPLPLTPDLNVSTLAIPIDDVVGSNSWKKFETSDITIDPSTGNYVLLASHEKAIAVITPSGDVVRSGPLPKGHDQAEGIAITKDSILIVSDESVRKPAQMTLYRWHP